MSSPEPSSGVSRLGSRASLPVSAETEVADVGPARTTSVGHRLALWSFVAYLAVSLVVLVAVIGDFHWFIVDEWDFLATRTAGDVDDLFRPHNEHWVTLPVLAYRGLWNLFGLHSYVPYQVMGVSLHLAVVALVRVVMRRAGVSPWMATCAAAPLVLFGPGGQNILWAFQIAFTGALAFGLVQLILSDHDGPLDRRDWLGLAAGLGALMCSNVGVAMVAMAGLAVLLRRGWRMALFHTAPLAAVFAVWWLIYRPTVTTAEVGRPTVGQLLDFVFTGQSESILAVGHYPIVGWVIVAVAIAGSVLLWSQGQRRDVLSRTAAPLSLFVGGIAFFLTAGVARAVLGDIEALGQRFIYVGAAMAMPIIAVAADQIGRRWPPLAPVLMVLFLVGIPANIGAFDTFVPPPEEFASRRQWTLALPTTELAEEVPRSLQPDPGGFGSPGLTVGWLLDAKANGDLPEPRDVSMAVAAHNRLRLGIALSEGSAAPDCPERADPLIIVPQRGDSIGLTTQVEVTSVDDAGNPFGVPLRFNSRDGDRLDILVDGLRLQLRPVFPLRTYAVCL